MLASLSLFALLENRKKGAIVDLIKYVKQEFRWAYIRRHLKPSEIDYDYVISDPMIKLNLEFFYDNWRKMTFGFMIDSMNRRYPSVAVNSFLATEVPLSVILDHLYFFLYRDDFLKLIRDIKLWNSAKEIELNEPAAYAKLVNNGNLDINGVVSKVKSRFYDKESLKLFWNEIADKNFHYVLQYLDKYRETNNICDEALEEVYLENGGLDIDRVKNKFNKGKLWIKLKWLGLKNIVQKLFKN